MTEHQIQWFVDNFTEDRDRILFLLDREERIAKYTQEEIYEACAEIMKVQVGKISLEGLLYKVSELGNIGVRAGKAGKVLREIFNQMKTIIEVQVNCYYRRKGFGYFKSLAGDRFRLRGDFEKRNYTFKIEIK